MPIHISFGSTTLDLSASDLSKYLQPGTDKLITLAPALLNLLDTRVSDVPVASTSAQVAFSSSPTWTIPQAVKLSLSVDASAACSVSILKPGDQLFTYTTDQQGDQTVVLVPGDVCYVSIVLNCHVALDAGASWSGGNFGVSATASAGRTYRLANYYAVAPSTTLRTALGQAFSNFVLPFQADSIERLPEGDYADFEFDGKLALGFGATYGFSGMFFGGASAGEVSASGSSPVGKMVLKAAPSYQVGAKFKIDYSHEDTFRVVVARKRSGASVYLLRTAKSSTEASESVGITLSAGAKFQIDASTLEAEAATVAQQAIPGPAGVQLGAKVKALAGQAVDEINGSVQSLLSKADGLKVGLELSQSRSRSNTALFLYDFDFSFGTGAVAVALAGNYAAALAMPGVTLDPRSYVEQVFLSSAGLNFEFFNLLKFSDVTQYVNSSEILYVGGRTFQLRDTAVVKSISGLFGKEREADLYFIAQCKTVAGSLAVSDADVKLRAVFIDRNNAAAFDETRRMLAAVGLDSLSTGVQQYVARNPKGTVQLRFDVDAAQLAGIQATAYAGNRPPAEPHVEDSRNYEQFVRSVTAIIGPVDTVASTYEQYFGRYADWLMYNRAVTDENGSARPGNRLEYSNGNGQNWPDGYPPNDVSIRILVQTYIRAGQAFMNMCAGVQALVATLPGVDTTEQFDELYDSVARMVRKDTPFPTYFLKPSIAALLSVARVHLTPAGDVPDPAVKGAFVIDLKPAAALLAAGSR
jgi:hypothetical protein